ncbi:MAG: chemotaxis protein CheW [Steroidobacterales bacterium]
MSLPLNDIAPAARAAVHDCWNRIGVLGDASCAELAQHIHCRNCPVYSAAAVALLDIELPPDFLRHWTTQVAQEKALIELDTHSVLVFRIAAEWLALRAGVLQEIVSSRAIHSIPHRRDGVVLGLVNIRGELLVCFSLQQILGPQPAADLAQEKNRVAAGRLLVIQSDGGRAVCPVDEVLGLARFRPRELTPVPATVAKSAATYTRSMLCWQQRAVGLLDEQLLLHTVNRSLT